LPRFLRVAGVEDLAHRSRSARVAPAQVVEFSFLAHLEVYGAFYPACEGADISPFGRGLDTPAPYPPTAEVREEVVTLKLLGGVLQCRGVIENAPRDRAARRCEVAVVVEKPGSNASACRPRSPLESTLVEMSRKAANVPSGFTTRTLPACSATKGKMRGRAPV
jgi:hypothetical protein